MALKDIIARGVGFSPGAVQFIVTHGFGAGEDAAVTGGYTPYAVYDPGQEKRVRARRRELRRERDKLRADLQFLVSGGPEKAPEKRPEITTQVVERAVREPRRDRTAENALALQMASIAVRQARLEVIGNELLALDVEFRAIQARARGEARRLARENELLTILLLAS